MSTPWNPAYKRKSKTYTSSEVKARYNANHYDTLTFRAPKGSLDAAKKLAALRGMSLAALMKLLLQQEAERAGKPEFSDIFTPPPEKLLSEFFNITS